MKEHNGKSHTRIFRISLNEPQLVEDGVPIVIAVDQDDVNRLDARKGLKAQLLMKDERLAVFLLPLRDVESRQRIDDMSHCAMRFAIVENPSSVGALVGADLDDYARL